MNCSSDIRQYDFGYSGVVAGANGGIGGSGGGSGGGGELNHRCSEPRIPVLLRPCCLDPEIKPVGRCWCCI